MPKQSAKTTSKSKSPVAKKAAGKASKGIKKDAVKEKRVDAKKTQVKKGTKATSATAKVLDLGLLLDCTSSMYSWIDRAKKTLQEIVQNVVDSCDGNLKVRVTFVGYRDHCDQKRFEILDFSEDIPRVKEFISKVQAIGGGDFPEDVVGGLRKCLDQAWLPDSQKQVFHIFDAPCHGRKYCDGWDSYPNGDPHGLELEPLMKEFEQKKIAFTCIKLNEQCNKMIKAMQENHKTVQITDLAHASQVKSAGEIDKIFVESASYILRAAVGGGGKGGKGSASKRTANKNAKPLWNPKKLEPQMFFSCISYLRVEKIEGNNVTVVNQHGGGWHISKDILVRDMWSADHFDQEIKCGMTDLSEILESCGDTIFKVKFKKKVDHKNIEEKLSNVKPAVLKKDAELKKLAKELVEGEECEIIGHLIESDNNLGRSVVIDVEAKEPHNFKQVDHRTIEWIIFKNVKYSLGRKAKDTPELPIKHDKTLPRWDEKKLAVGNCFSSISYFKVKSVTDKDNAQVVTPNNTTQELTMSRDILEKEMYAAGIFDKEEKISRTNLVELMTNARETAVTVNFHKKVDDAYVKEILANAGKQDFSDGAKLKALAKQLSLGKETEMTCFLTKSEGKLGRSTCIDLNAPWGMNFRQIDHRTVESLILKNVKYTVK